MVPAASNWSSSRTRLPPRPQISFTSGFSVRRAHTMQCPRFCFVTASRSSRVLGRFSSILSLRHSHSPHQYGRASFLSPHSVQQLSGVSSSFYRDGFFPSSQHLEPFLAHVVFFYPSTMSRSLNFMRVLVLSLSFARVLVAYSLLIPLLCFLSFLS